MRVGEPSGLATPSASGAAASVAVERQDGAVAQHHKVVSTVRLAAFKSWRTVAPSHTGPRGCPVRGHAGQTCDQSESARVSSSFA